ncbi:MAG: M67 family metallopeptidase, partial [Desulfovibrio sp.]|nr:M67 family metallopeptidase [Desulfovibrio sp.]
MTELPSDKQHAIRLEGEKAYPGECCGFLLGVFEATGPRHIVDILPMCNARETEAQHNRFLIAPVDFMRAERHARAAGLEIVGFYHSHPDHPALPSDYDREQALPFYCYIIVSVNKAKAEGLT